MGGLLKGDAMRFSHFLTCIVICALIVLAMEASTAGLLDQAQKDFASCLVITGYDEYSNFNEPAAIAIDNKSGRMGIADAGSGEVYVFGIQGAAEKRIGPEHGIKSPLGVAIGSDGRIYITDKSSESIEVIAPDGSERTVQLPRAGDDQKPTPGRMTIDRDGNLYVTDRANSRICVFDNEGKLRLAFGRKGGKRGGFESLEDVAVDRQGRIYAADSAGSPVQVFDKKGKYLYKFGFRGLGDEDVSFAAGLFIDPNDQVWVVDRGSHSLKVFDRTGAFLRKFGQYGTEPGMLFQPVDADMDSFGRVYVLEAGAKRLQAFLLRRSFERFTQDGL